VACLAAKPVVDGLEQELGGRVTFVRVDIQTEAGEALAARYQVTGVPAFLAFDRDGRVLARTRGPGGARELGRVLRD
jgi:thiol-disulfide isomerase/thioredoxin